MNSHTNNQSTTSDENDNIPDVWRPAWAVPVAVILYIVSVIDLCITGLFGCFLAYIAISGLGTFLWDDRPTESILYGLTASCLLIGLGLYPQGKQRKVCGIILAILLALIFILGIMFGMVEIIGVGFLGALMLHGSALCGIGLYKFSDRVASPSRWREIHLKNNQCQRCRYNISNLPEPRCPECGETW